MSISIRLKTFQIRRPTQYKFNGPKCPPPQTTTDSTYTPLKLLPRYLHWLPLPFLITHLSIWVEFHHHPHHQPRIRIPVSYIFRWTKLEVNTKHQDYDHPYQVTKHLLAAIGFETDHGPEHVHLAYMGQCDGEIRVMLVTHNEDKSFMRYGERECGLKSRVGVEIRM